MSLQSLTVVTPPALEVVTVEEAKQHLRLTWADEDTWVAGAIRAARAWLEPRAGRALIAQTLRAVFVMDLNRRPNAPLEGYLGRTMRELTFTLPRAVGAVSVALVEMEKDLATWLALTAATDYVADVDAEPAAVWLRASALSNWMPSGALTTFIGAALPRVRITYTAGYGAGPSSVPDDWRQAVLNIVAFLYENRGTGATIPDSMLAGLDLIWNV